MTSTSLDDKIRAAFGEFAVDKGLIRRMGVAGDDRHVPSYVMDWIVTYTAKTQKTTSSLERAVQEFIAKHLPAKGEKERIRFKLAQGEVLTVLDAISVTVKLGREVRYLASIPVPGREQGEHRSSRCSRKTNRFCRAAPGALPRSATMRRTRAAA